MPAARWILLLAGFIAFAARAEHPNVVLMVVDTLRADRVEAQRNGVPVMPKMHGLARWGWNFTRAYAPCSWTKPSVTSLFTGLYPRTHGVQNGSQLELKASEVPQPIEGVPAAKELAAEYFKRQGYTTLAYQTNRLLRPADGYARGFDGYTELKDTGAYQVNQAVYKDAGKLKPPFFLYVHYMDPHAPYGTSGNRNAFFGELPALSGGERGRMEKHSFVEEYYLEFWRKADRPQPESITPLTAPEREYLRALYDVDCHTTDAGIARMVQEISRQWPDTIFVLVADHGEEFWEHGALGHGKTLFEELTQVPLIIFGKSLKPRVVDTPVEAIDILPTLAALCGLPPNPAWQGRSLAEENLEPRPVFGETHGTIRDAGIALESVVQGTQKLVRGAKGDALYDVAADPAEQHDVASAQPEAAAAMGRLLDAHHAACDAHPLAKVPPAYTPIDPALVERLQGLGYLGK